MAPTTLRAQGGVTAGAAARALGVLVVAAACACGQSDAAPRDGSGPEAPGAATGDEDGSGPAAGQDGAGEASVWPDPLPPPDPDVPAARRAAIIGTWTPDDPARFDQAWLDEAGLREVFTGRRASRRAWRGISSATDVLPLDALLRDREGPAVAYAYVLSTRVTQDESGRVEDAPAVLHVRHRGRIQVRVDGRLVVDAPTPPPHAWGEARAPIGMTDTYDVVLVKVGRGLVPEGDGLDFVLRLTRPDGSPVPHHDWRVVRSPDYPSDLDRAPGADEPEPDPADAARPRDGR